MPDKIMRETFEAAEVPTKLNMLFDEVRILCQHMEDCRAHNEPRIKRLERRRGVDTGISAGAGLAGGFLAVIAKMKFWGG